MNSRITGGGAVDHPTYRTRLFFRGPHGIIVIVVAIMGARKPLIAGHATGYVAYPDVNRSGVVLGSTVADAKPKWSQSPMLLVSSPTGSSAVEYFGFIEDKSRRYHGIESRRQKSKPRMSHSAGEEEIPNRDHRAIAWSQPFISTVRLHRARSNRSCSREKKSEEAQVHSLPI
ncbi:hypothetical protein GW17_00036042 [Ensete ventricosum]|nr:hypothetical protein GW17_00036042 [Ensete ventricosum]